MRQINWKSLSLSLILSTGIHGVALSLLLYQYFDTLSIVFHEVLSQMNTTNASGKITYTIAQGKPPLPFWAGVLIFMVSYSVVTMISYFFIEGWNRRKQ